MQKWVLAMTSIQEASDTHLVLSAATQIVAGILRPSSTPYSARALRMDLTTDCRSWNCCRASVSTGPEEEGHGALIKASPAQHQLWSQSVDCICLESANTAALNLDLSTDAVALVNNVWHLQNKV